MARLTDDDTIELRAELSNSPLQLEEPGKISEALAQFVRPERLERLKGVLSRRIRGVTALIEFVNNPHNTAACVRSCDAFGIQDLHVVTQDGDPLKVALGITKGAHRWLTIHTHETIEEAVKVLKQNGYHIAATDPGGEDRAAAPIEALPLEHKVCIAFGNERDGISPTLRREADSLTVIPMQGFVESFNISVAFALCLHATRRRFDEQYGGAGDLSETDQNRILDRWFLDEVPQAMKVLKELDRRVTEGS
ncbi:MAG: RNA methyltransferase [Myxococcota bacterium]|nr:RNA methyltransferase [Myxococcota bacterium]